MIRLTRYQPNQHDAVVRIEGRLDSESIGELDAFLADTGSPRSVSLDLSGLASVDDQGRSAFLRLQAAGHRLFGASLYIRKLLEEPRP